MMSALWSMMLVTAFSILPIPAEVFMFRNLHAYGVLPGTVLNWSGALLGAEILFLFTRFVRISIARTSKFSYPYRLFSREQGKLQKIWGLILVRVLPVPAKAVDITAGIIRTITWWEFTWTTAVGMIPYQLFMILIYHGWQARSFYMLLVVTIIIVCSFVILLRMRKR
jgi:uncharacterized membrane protein YdjX (TVP38/TMEM64 family)